MIDAFTLWGQLKADTKQFESALASSEKRLEDTSKAVTKLERQTRSMGDVTAVSGRKFEKYNDTIKSHKDRLLAAATAYENGTIGSKKYAAIVTQTSNDLDKLNSRLSDQKARLNDLPGVFSTVAKYAAGAGVAIAGFSIKAAMDMDGYRNRLQAMLGDAGKANAKFKELLDLSRKSVGTSISMALDAYSQLKAMGTIGESSIMKLVSSLGRLNIAFQIPNMQQFIRNLMQLFQQGFEMQDWKEAIGQVPIFEQLVEKAFGVKDKASLLKLKESGKITIDSWIDGIATAIETDERLKNLTQTFGTRLSRLFDEINISASGLGAKLEVAIRPALDKVIAELQKDNPEWGNIGEIIGNQIGAGINKGLQSFGNSESGGLSALLKKWMGDAGLVGPIIRGMLEDAGFEKSFDGFYHALEAMGEKVNVALGGVKGVINTAINPIGAIASALGSAIGQGLVNGMKSKWEEVKATASMIGRVAIDAASTVLNINSPSKEFISIGKSIGEGLIDGIASMKTGVSASMASMLDISGLKTGKGSAIGVEMLTELVKELDQFTERTRSQEVAATMTARAWENVEAHVKGAVKAAANQVDFEKTLKGLKDIGKDLKGDALNGMERLRQLWVDLSDKGDPVAEAVERINKAFSEPDVITGMANYSDRVKGIVQSLYELKAIQSIGGQGEGSGRSANNEDDGGPGILGEPPTVDYANNPWVKFWNMMDTRIAHLKEQLPTLKQSIADNLTYAIEGVGDVFGDAVRQWDGTAKGFFKSLASGFSQMVSQIAAELVRLMVIKAVMQIIGAVAGGVGGGGSIAHTAAGGATGGHADGGFISGPGSGTSDSIMARLSNGEFVMSAKSVAKFGKGFFDRLNTGMMPAFAGGGMVGSTFNNQSYGGHTVNVFIQGGGGTGGLTRHQIEQAAIAGLHKAERRNK